MTALEAQPEPRPLEEEIIELAKLLKPREFDARLAYWQRGGLPGGMSADLVKSSRAAKLPALDRMDQTIARDRVRYADALRDAAAARARGDLRKARRLLQSAVAIQKTWLYPIEVASEDLGAMVSDGPKCLNCPENTPRLRAGRCHACYQYWNLHDRKDERPEELWSKPKRKRAS